MMLRAMSGSIKSDIYETPLRLTGTFSLSAATLLWTPVIFITISSFHVVPDLGTGLMIRDRGSFASVRIAGSGCLSHGQTRLLRMRE